MSNLPTPPKALNPLWVIFAFFSFSEVVLGVAVFNTVGAIQLALVYFVIAFPVFIATIFFMILWFRPQHLYAPKDFSSDESFLKSMAAARSVRLSQFAENLEVELHQRLVSPQLVNRLSSVKSDQVEGVLRDEADRITDEIKKSAFITVDLSAFSPTLSPLTLPIGALSTLNALTDEVYFAINEFVKPYAYGHEWVLRNTATNEVIKNRRMLSGAPAGQPLSDNRSLAEVGIEPGTTLDVIPVAKRRR
jgi:hypothetical protein